jgi:hypothetical protein
VYRTVGTDSSGRPIRMTPLMERFWADLCNRLGFTPTIVQGAWMQGAGAADSAGYHDQGGPLDLRVWDLTDSQVRQVIREWRLLGGPIWLRDARHGMDPHLHGVVGGDEPMAPGARWQIEEYAAGRDGLTSRGRDYHPRPSPLVTVYKPAAKSEEDDDMQLSDKLYPRLADSATVGDALKAVIRLEKAERRREELVKTRLAAVRQAVARNATKAEVEQLLNSLDAEITIVVRESEG